jgi:adenylate cyclase, class 2
MAREIEAKYRLRDPAGLRRILMDRGARCEGLMHEDDTLFDTADGQLGRGGRGLRLRTWCATDGADGKTAVLTYKGPREAGVLKIREELETTVADAPALTAILERLGFRPAVGYEKRREVWLLGPCEVCVDEMPKLGWFAEIEGPDERAVTELGAELGLTGELIQDTYVSLALRHGEAGSAGYPRLTFGA